MQRQLATPGNAPNIVLINVDQWRGDCLGAAGHPVVETPHLDRLFADGVRFTRAYAAVPSCIAARASLHTGLRPSSHGRVGYQDGVPWDYPTTLAGLFADAGYHTQAVGKMHVSPARNLLGFHNVVLHDGYLHVERRAREDLELVDDYLPWLREKVGPDADYIDTGIGCNGYVVRPWVYSDMQHPSAWVTSQAIDFLRRRDPGRPFMLFASYHRPHPPLDPPRDYLAMYERKTLPSLPEGAWSETFPPPARGIDSPCPLTDAEIARARRAYYAQITFIDHQLNRLTQALWAHGCLNNTCFLFCADHGDMLYDHALVAKCLPYEGSANIPFMLRFPRNFDGIERGTVSAPVELRDVLPTLCDVAGVPIPESIEGRSVVPLCREHTASWRSYLHGEHAAGQLSNHWLTDGRAKYVWYSQSGREQLFNLNDDPTEEHDLTAANSDALTVWRGRLVDELDGREEGYVADGRLVPGRRPRAVLSSVRCSP